MSTASGARATARLALLLLLAVALLPAGCAWSNRANRPVWNAFEAHLVPEDDTAFYATLPLTVPAGVLSILADSFVVHPIRVMDDAWDDAADVWEKDVWDEDGWQHAYYTSLALLPFRLVVTPVVFVVSFLGRSLFDVPGRHHQHGEEVADPPDALAAEDDGAAEDDDAARRERRIRELLEAAANRSEPVSRLYLELTQMDWPEWTPELSAAWEEAITRAEYSMRQVLFELARFKELQPWRTDPFRGLRDPSAIVRYEQLKALPARTRLPPELLDALRRDPEEAVREIVQRRWPLAGDAPPSD